MYTCAECADLACRNEEPPEIPENCPMHDKEFYRQLVSEYKKEENISFFQESSRVEKEGYCIWPRAKEITEFCSKMNYMKIGVVFCSGLKREAAVFTNILRNSGLDPISVVCKNGGISKEILGLKESDKINPQDFEAACNPIGQALLLNKEKCEFNVVIGLCVGHDSLFFKYSHAPVTVLVAKDRVLAHNTAGALYCHNSYYKNKLG
ncbi:MAG: DUF1847 domain-containing protein [Clostridia bacterium]|nr:DUF1847 domain-containing protein [Clostridia bacterium]